MLLGFSIGCLKSSSKTLKKLVNICHRHGIFVHKFRKHLLKTVGHSFWKLEAISVTCTMKLIERNKLGINVTLEGKLSHAMPFTSTVFLGLTGMIGIIGMYVCSYIYIYSNIKHSFL